ncbi:MAG: choice-of-anchor Q domain-containing protein [Thermoanaerobaculales bacterium]|jgi:parallel beta-helix repeat protein|nr:choice-of-anchor Q domain-containing protein [Thermoanaerobaculales bacterium]
MVKHSMVVMVAIGALVVTAAPTASQELVFSDGFGSGDLWGWNRFPGGAPSVGSCPTEVVVTGTEFFVDPVGGSDTTGDGSPGNPWASIQDVVSNRVDCTDQYGTPQNPGAPIRGGDAIVLVGAAGHDPNLQITGCYNSAWVTIRAQVRHQPELASVHFRGSEFWRLEGLSFVNDAAGTMVRVEDHGTQGPARRIEIVNCHLTSGDLPTIPDWVDHVSDAFRLYTSHGPLVIRCNHLVNVAMGFVVGSDNVDIIGNTVEYFSRDGIATGGHDNRFVGNAIYDSVKLGDGHHDDFFQSHMGANPDTSSDVLITGNRFINRYGSGQPADSLGPTQCLSGFEDGPKTRLTITNNLCKGDHWHGITWYDTNNSVIVNNTAVGGSNFPGLPAGSSDWPDYSWISVQGTGNTIRNNLTTRNLSGGDHNLEIQQGETDLYFADWPGLDLHLAPGSPAIDAGSADGATSHDLDGVPRDSQPDVGAYEATDG